jgi:hypothetical protein
LTFYLLCNIINYRISFCQALFDLVFKKVYERRMDKVLSIKIDPRMKKAVEDLAEKEFAPVTTIVKKALDKYLQEHGIDWRKEPEKKSRK